MPIVLFCHLVFFLFLILKEKKTSFSFKNLLAKEFDTYKSQILATDKKTRYDAVLMLLNFGFCAKFYE